MHVACLSWVSVHPPSNFPTMVKSVAELLTIRVVHGKGQAVAKRIIHMRLQCPDFDENSTMCSGPCYLLKMFEWQV